MHVPNEGTDTILGGALVNFLSRLSALLESPTPTVTCDVCKNHVDSFPKTEKRNPWKSVSIDETDRQTADSKQEEEESSTHGWWMGNHSRHAIMIHEA